MHPVEVHIARAIGAVTHLAGEVGQCWAAQSGRVGLGEGVVRFGRCLDIGDLEEVDGIDTVIQCIARHIPYRRGPGPQDRQAIVVVGQVSIQSNCDTVGVSLREPRCRDGEDNIV